MARINLEDSLHKDSRFVKLCIKFGSRRTALGAIVEAWMLADSYVDPSNPRALIPKEDWQSHEIANEIIEVGLASIEDEKIYIRGAEKHFKWKVQRQLAGQRGGLMKASNAKRPLAVAKQNVPSISISISKEINNTGEPDVDNSVDNPNAQAQRCFQGIQRYGPDEMFELKKFVGEELFERVRKTIGWNSVRESKRDNWAVPNLAKKLAEAPR